jgi:hypothetical protein
VWRAASAPRSFFCQDPATGLHFTSLVKHYTSNSLRGDGQLEDGRRRNNTQTAGTSVSYSRGVTAKQVDLFTGLGTAGRRARRA